MSCIHMSVHVCTLVRKIQLKPIVIQHRYFIHQLLNDIILTSLDNGLDWLIAVAIATILAT